MGSLPKNKKKIPKSIHEMSKDELQETLRKKKECNAKAQETVIKMCDTNISEEWFLANLQFINQCHFEDATVERSITKICGYPLCDNKLEKVPTQQYHISTKYNKVFDISERKNFCSGICYKAAVHVKNQLFTSPLWFRDQEKIPKYSLMKQAKSAMGEEVNIEPDRVKLEPEDLKIKLASAENKTTTLKKDSTNKSLRTDTQEIEEKFFNLKIESSSNNENESKNKCDNIQSNNILDCDKDLWRKVDSKETDTIVRPIISKNVDIFKETSNTPKNLAVFTKATTPITSKEKRKANKEKSKKQKQEPVNVVSKIEQSIFEWFSLDTLFHLYGENKLRELFKDKAEKLKGILNSKMSTVSHTEKIEKMLRLYELLDTSLNDCSAEKPELKPLPDYSALKEEGMNLEIKVKAFFHGQLEIKPVEKKEDEKKEEEKDKNDSNPLYLPLIDAHAQVSLRRKIVLDKLIKVLHELIKLFSSNYIFQMNDARNLVSTFTLSAHNITFKPSEWYLVGLIILKFLSIKDKHLRALVREESSKLQITAILMNYDLPEDYLDNLISRISNYECLVKKVDETLCANQ